MILAFYKVTNHLDFDRHTFDGMTNEEIVSELKKLPSEEVRFYDLSRTDWSSPFPCLADFVEDYNDEELDGGWWCIVLK